MHSFLHALSGLSRHAEDAFPRELVPLILNQSARALLAAQVFHSGPHWLWPYWVTRQLDPYDTAYLPRAMSPLWHNLTHRNWTAIGIPDSPREAVVDPRGLVMPQHGGFSIDVAVLLPNGEEVAPAELREGYEQRMSRFLPLVQGRFRAGPLTVSSHVWADVIECIELVRLKVHLTALVDVTGAHFVVSLRPYNPEGPALVHRIDSVDFGWRVDGKAAVVLRQPAAERSLSSFWRGDAISAERSDDTTVFCPAGFASAAAFYPLELSEGQTMALEFVAPMDPARATEASLRRLSMPTPQRHPGPARPTSQVRAQWREKRSGAARIALPLPAHQRLFDQAHQTLLVLDDGDCIRPGPLTYHQHWFRDSAYLVSALARLGHQESARRKLQSYRERQDRDGFFRSQAGEWDSCGQAIWTLVEYGRLFHPIELLRA
ncbi:MAG: hypothetical protein ACO3JL_15005, partial [Myxococcota bacterium]